MSDVPGFDKLFASSHRIAWHLEMRDGYMRSDPSFQAWKNGTFFDRSGREAWWISIVSEAVKRGVEVRRARIVSEPVSDYIRWEHSVTASTNLAGGEEVRWLPRRLASDLALPGNDFWVFDDLVLFNHFAGDGELAPEDSEINEDAQVVKLCCDAFEAVWQRAIPHQDYVVN